MKMKTLLFACFSLLLLISCSQGSGNRETDSDDAGMVNEADSTDSTLVAAEGEETFDRFIERFSNDESFQLKRIKFPISVVIPDTQHQGMAPMEESIGKYEWEQLDLTYDSTYLTRPYDQYFQAVRFKNDTAVVEIRGINNGIYADYYFARINNKWFLVTLYEASF